MDDPIVATFTEGTATVEVIGGQCFHAREALYLRARVRVEGPEGPLTDENKVLGYEWWTGFGDCCFMPKESLADLVKALTLALKEWEAGGWERARDAACAARAART